MQSNTFQMLTSGQVEVQNCVYCEYVPEEDRAQYSNGRLIQLIKDSAHFNSRQNPTERKYKATRGRLVV